MTIKVNYVHNAQAVHVEGTSWQVEHRLQQQFDYLNARYNKKQLFAPSLEMQQAWYGNY